MYQLYMKKKILILSLILTFFVSTVGLPLTMHLCEMNMQEEMCGMCAVKIDKKSCCDDSEADEVITAAISICCSIKIVDESVKDKFVQSKSEQYLYTNHLCLLPSSVVDNYFNVSGIIYFQSDNSPPHLFSNSLYLTNSIFLI